MLSGGGHMGPNPSISGYFTGIHWPIHLMSVKVKVHF